MGKINITIITLLLICSNCYSQHFLQPLEVVEKGWQRLYIKNVGGFDFPLTLEIQEGNYKELVDNLRGEIGLDIYDAPLTLQQIGLNEGSEKSFEKYARVSFDTEYGIKGDFLSLNFNISDISQSEILEINDFYKTESQQYFQNDLLKLIEWYPIKLEKINGMSCIHLSYKRQLKNHPIVLVNSYYFFNFDRLHTLTLAYRLNESQYWKEDFYKILKSLRIFIQE